VNFIKMIGTRFGNPKRGRRKKFLIGRTP